MNAIVIRIIAAMAKNLFVRLMFLMIAADMIFGSLRAVKYRKWNSAIGIDGAIRKIAMIAGVLLLTIVDMILTANILGWLPMEWQDMLQGIGIVKMGFTELFALLFIMYEATSVLKNMLLCGVPIPKGIREKLANWLDTMTEESNVEVRNETCTPVGVTQGE